MSKRLTVVLVLAVFALAGILIAQVKYPNIDDPAVVLDNDHVVVQKLETQTGQWSGVHTHDGNQLVVALDDLSMTYKEGGEEIERSFKKGDVFWLDAVEHDHMATSSGSVVVITIK